MSAFICHPATPDTLAGVASPALIARTVARIYPGGVAVDDANLNDARRVVARYLASLNVRAVAYRYPSDTVNELPGHAYGDWAQGSKYHPMPSESAHPFRVTRLAAEVANTARSHGDLTPSQVAACRRVLGLAVTYVYQACELPEWDGSAAREFVDGVRLEVAARLAEGWEFDGAQDSDMAWLNAGRQAVTA